MPTSLREQDNFFDKKSPILQFLDNAESVSRKNIGNIANFVIGHIGCTVSMAVGFSMGAESLALSAVIIAGTNRAIDMAPDKGFLKNLKECACRRPSLEKPKSLLGKIRYSYQSTVNPNIRRYVIQPATYALAGFAFGHYVMGHESTPIAENQWTDPKTNKEYIIKEQKLCSPSGNRVIVDTLEIGTLKRYQPN